MMQTEVKREVKRDCCSTINT